MIRRDSIWRLVGMLAVGAAAGSSLLHRGVLTAHAGGPASALEVVIGLASFALASWGVLLLIHGARLHDAWADRRHRAGLQRDSVRSAGADKELVPTALAADPGEVVGGKAAIAMMLGDRAIGAAAARRRDSAPVPRGTSTRPVS